MKVDFFSNKYFNVKKNNIVIPNHIVSSMYLNYDTVSFAGMKKSKFKGADAIVVEKFKAPIEKFDSNEDLQDWAKSKCDEIVNIDYHGRTRIIRVKRKEIIDEWVKYVREENGNYSSTQQLLILDGITKSLNPYQDNLPLTLNKRALADVMSEIQDINNKQYNFLRAYKNKLQTLLLKPEGFAEDNYTGWVVIPSEKHDGENFKENVKKLQTLSHDNWCTKSYNAEPYLEEGDFHVYLEAGKPKLGVRFIGCNIEEIQGERNDNAIPLEYIDVINQYIEKNNYKLGLNAENEICFAENIQKSLHIVKNAISLEKGANDFEKLLNYMKIDFKKNEEGKYIINNNFYWSFPFPYKMLELEPKNLFDNISEIKGNAYFKNSGIEDLGNLELIGKDANFEKSKITNFGKLKKIGGDADFIKAQVISLGNLEIIGGSACFYFSNIKSLGKLKEIKGCALFSHSSISNLENLEKIGEDADFSYARIMDFGALKEIGRNANFEYSSIYNLGNLEKIGGYANFQKSKIKSLGNLEKIGGDVYFQDVYVNDLGLLKKIKGIVYVNQNFIPMEVLKNITDEIYIMDSY